LTPYSRSRPSVRYASAYDTELSAAAPKIARVLLCPVLPKGAFAIIADTLLN